MPKLLKTILQFIGFLGIGILLIWLVTKNLTPAQVEEIKDALRRANYWVLAPAAVLGFLSHWVRAMRWRLLFLPLGYEPRKLNTFFAVMVGYLVNLAVPRLGEVTRCGILARYEKIPVDKLVGTMIAERAFDLICLIVLITVTILIQVDVVADIVARYITDPLANMYANASVSRLLIVLAVIAGVVLLFLWLLRRFARTKAAIALRALIRGVMEGIFSVFKMKQKGWFLFYTAAMWLLYFSQVYIAFQCLPETMGLGVKAGLSILAFGSIGMIVTQGGIGAYQIIVQNTLVLYGIQITIGYAFGWIIWVAQTLLVIVLGLLSLLGFSVYNKHYQPAPRKTE
ncbi:lysylphosphatidylglycerol synthase transmembrane domain-containing protein [Chitinophaga sp. 22620]|uniref:lysylphosphatidylglycerol synthase transmembrane domain-containing protein n=1 Tax=Chitinophaga sp. 22620 TaxID=3453952 RepID=UPI003F84F442